MQPSKASKSAGKALEGFEMALMQGY